jgi:hypothetical protein
VPAGAIPSDAAKDPKSCLIAVTIELREHAIARAAKVLRESGATPGQVKVGIQLALGMPKPAIADDLGIKVSSVKDITEKLYQTLDVHNAAELGTKIWLGEKQNEAQKSLRPALPVPSEWRTKRPFRVHLPIPVKKPHTSLKGKGELLRVVSSMCSRPTAGDAAQCGKYRKILRGERAAQFRAR